jgi:phosphate transport system protein
MDENTIEEIFTLNTDIKSKSSDAIDNIIGEMKNNSKTSCFWYQFNYCIETLRKNCRSQHKRCRICLFYDQCEDYQARKFTDKK